METIELSYEEFVKRLTKKNPTETLDLFHGPIGLAGEAGELLDAIKRHAYYGREIDLENVLEELGDAMFYIVMTANHFGISQDQIINYNVRKLSKRYSGLKFSEAGAIGRADKVSQDGGQVEQSASPSHS